MRATFEPAAQPALRELGPRLPELAGTSFAAGQKIYRSGVVLQRAVTPASASASIQGSGANPYRVTLAFADTLKPGCTCPAFRRNPWCKHVVALCLALLDEPASFLAVDAPPEISARAPRVRRAAQAADEGQLRSAGLETVDRVLDSLAEGGLLSLGAEKQDLLNTAADLVAGLKLGRLARLLDLLRRAAASGALDAGAFANLLSEIWLVRQTVGAQLEGRIALDDALAEDLVGRVWRARDREKTSGLALVQVAYVREQERDNRVETSYLLDLADGTCYLECKITPVALRREPPKPSYSLRLDVQEAEVYPGPSPRRLKLLHIALAPLLDSDVVRLLGFADRSVDRLRERLVAHQRLPFALAELPVLFQPAALVSDGATMAALDEHGGFVRLAWPEGWNGRPRGRAAAAREVLPADEPYAIFGRLDTQEAALVLRPLALVSPGLRWNLGPLYPAAEGT